MKTYTHTTAQEKFRGCVYYSVGYGCVSYFGCGSGINDIGLCPNSSVCSFNNVNFFPYQSYINRALKTTEISTFSINTESRNQNVLPPRILFL
jgi:hypothetical protein